MYKEYNGFDDEGGADSKEKSNIDSVELEKNEE